jgi:hypothetical protein
MVRVRSCALGPIGTASFGYRSKWTDPNASSAILTYRREVAQDAVMHRSRWTARIEQQTFPGFFRGRALGGWFIGLVFWGSGRFATFCLCTVFFLGH